MEKRKVIIYTDGSASHRDKYGGWGICLMCGDVTVEKFGGMCEVTSSQMELMAIQEALRSLKRESKAFRATIYSDSQYSVKAHTLWCDKWQRHNWIKSDGDPVANVEILKETRRLLGWLRSAGHNIRFRWVRGHAGLEGNELADKLAKRGRAAMMLKHGKLRARTLED
jgi:ribonuclease HI